MNVTALVANVCRMRVQFVYLSGTLVPQLHRYYTPIVPLLYHPRWVLGCWRTAFTINVQIMCNCAFTVH
jgi:hypothetical protein